MTFEEFVSRVANVWMIDKASGGDFRIGQVLFNELDNVRPRIAESIHGTARDPFFDTELSLELLGYISERWND